MIFMDLVLALKQNALCLKYVVFLRACAHTAGANYMLKKTAATRLCWRPRVMHNSTTASWSFTSMSVSLFPINCTEIRWLNNMQPCGQEKTETKEARCASPAHTGKASSAAAGSDRPWLNPGSALAVPGLPPPRHKARQAPAACPASPVNQAAHTPPSLFEAFWFAALNHAWRR